MIAKFLTVPVRAALVALALVAWAAPSQAQQPSANSVALAKEIITAKGSADFYNSVASDVIEQMKLNFLQTNPMISKDLNEVAAKMRTEFASRNGQLLNDVAKIYATRFTEAELKEILAFYKSPVGKKVVAQEPQIVDESLAVGREFIGKFSDEVMPRFRTEMKKKGHDL